MSTEIGALPRNLLDEAVHLLVKAANPTKIILFGSRARGDARPDSDLDLLVILPQVSRRRNEMVRLESVLSTLNIPIDVLVYSMQDIADWGHVKGTVLYPALQEGIVVYEAA